MVEIAEQISQIANKFSDGQHRMICPGCAHTRSNSGQRNRTLSVQVGEGKAVYTCWHCDLSGKVFLNGEQPPAPKRPVALRPVREVSPLGEGALSYLLERGISEATAKTAGLFSTRTYFNKLGREGDAVGLPYFDQDGVYTGAKLRSIEEKDFTIQGTVASMFGAERTQSGQDLYIVEGELDAIAMLEAGLGNAISVPHGAPPPTKGGTNPQANDRRLAALWASRDAIKRASRIIIASDNDLPGEALAEEIARRVGKVRCWVLRWPEGIKDANEFLIEHGGETLKDYATSRVTMWPLSGLKSVSEFRSEVEDLYERGLPGGMKTGWPTIDEIYTVAPGSLNIITGVPGSGKSTWLDALLCNLAKMHDSRIALASFENPIPTHISKLAAQYVGKPFRDGLADRMTKQEMTEATDWVNEHFLFLSQDGEPPTTDNLVERFGMAVMRMGCRIGVIDPFNFIKLGGENETHAINEMLSALKTFAMATDMALFLVAHPAKPPGGTGKDWLPTGYQISGSAHFYNRADVGLTVQRGNGTDVRVHVWKSRFEHIGTLGSAPLVYQYGTGRYEEATTESLIDFDDLDF
jgi:twinkle protein